MTPPSSTLELCGLYSIFQVVNAAAGVVFKQLEQGILVTNYYLRSHVYYQMMLTGVKWTRPK